MRALRRRFWLAVFDVLDRLGGGLDSRRFALALWALRKASDATDWGEGADCSGGTGEGPF